MNRKIAFRVWDKKDKLWVAGWSIGQAGVQTETSNKVFMQYTGLQDKNGKEIYEGDIVIASKMPYYWEFVKSVNKGLVVYNNHTASYRIKLDNYHSSTIGESDTVKFNPVSKYEVIGNLYENPELLDK